jgi:hypothetical protein
LVHLRKPILLVNNKQAQLKMKSFYGVNLLAQLERKDSKKKLVRQASVRVDKVARSSEEIEGAIYRGKSFVIGDQIKKFDFEIQPSAGLKPTKRWMQALIESTSLTILQIKLSEMRDLSSKHWDYLMNGIIGNKSIKHLGISAIEFKNENIGYLCKIISENAIIESISFDDIIWRSSEEFSAVCNVLKTHPKIRFVEFKNALREIGNDLKLVEELINTNNIITTLVIKGRSFGNVSVRKICDIVQHAKVSSVILSDSDKSSINVAENIPKERTLEFIEQHFKEDHFREFCEVIKYCPTATSLDCRIRQHNYEEMINDVLKRSPTLLTLKYWHSTKENNRLLVQGLTSNRSVKNLHVSNVHNTAQYADLFKVVQKSKNIKSLTISGEPPRDRPILDLIQKSKNLKALDISEFGQVTDIQEFSAALKRNKSLQRLGLSLYQEKAHLQNDFFEALELHPSLTSLNICTEKFAVLGRKFWRRIEEVLHVNKRICNIECAKHEDCQVEMFTLLMNNEEEQRNFARISMDAVNLMAALQHIFFTKLPVELWAMILNKIHVPLLERSLGDTLITKVTNKAPKQTKIIEE